MGPGLGRKVVIWGTPLKSDQNQEILESLTAKSVNAFAMDQVPRVTIAQAYDVLSSLGCFRSDTLDSKLQKVFLIPRVTQVKSDKFGWKTRCN